MNETGQFVQITRQRNIPETDFYAMIVAMYEQIWQNLLPPQILPKGLTAKRARNVATPPGEPVPDCVTCGVCCAAMLCVGVRPGEDDLLGQDDYWDVTITDGDRTYVVDRYLRRDPESLMCANLDVGAEGRTTCRIYDRRPRMCRDFDAGSDKCHALRRAYGVEPFLSPDEMSAANERLDSAPTHRDPTTTIREVKFVPGGSGTLALTAYMLDGTVRVIHEFNPAVTVFRQFEFDAATLDEASEIIERRETDLASD